MPTVARGVTTSKPSGLSFTISPETVRIAPSAIFTRKELLALEAVSNSKSTSRICVSGARRDFVPSLYCISAVVSEPVMIRSAS